MPSMPYGSMHMPTGWNGLSMPTDGYSVHMPIVIANFKVGGVKYGLCPIYDEGYTCPHSIKHGVVILIP